MGVHDVIVECERLSLEFSERCPHDTCHFATSFRSRSGTTNSATFGKTKKFSLKFRLIENKFSVAQKRVYVQFQSHHISYLLSETHHWRHSVMRWIFSVLVWCFSVRHRQLLKVQGRLYNILLIYRLFSIIFSIALARNSNIFIVFVESGWHFTTRGRYWGYTGNHTGKGKGVGGWWFCFCVSIRLLFVAFFCIGEMTTTTKNFRWNYSAKQSLLKQQNIISTLRFLQCSFNFFIVYQY